MPADIAAPTTTPPAKHQALLAIVGETPPLILWYSDSCTSSKKLSESRNKSYPAGHSKLSILILASKQ